MRHLNKLASVFSMAALGLLALTGCEGGDLYNVDSPDWISQKIDSINNLKGSSELEIPAGTEDVYTIGKTDFSSGWWAEFSKYYVIPKGEKWDAVLNLNINPAEATKYYQNFALIITNDVDRGGTGYHEYGAIRFDLTGDANAFNSQWGDEFGAIEGNSFKYAESTLPLNPVDNIDANIQKYGGKMVLTVDRSQADRFTVTMQNASVKRTYDRPSELPNFNDDAANENIRCFLVPEGSYINFLQSNIEPIGGFTSAKDKMPLSIELQGVPEEVLLGISLEEAMEKVSATVTFEEGVTKVIPAAELMISAIPDMETLGEKTLLVIYNKTFKGENCETPIYATAKFNVVAELTPKTETVVFPTPSVIGELDNSTPWWTAFTENIKVAPRQTCIVNFTNYTNALNNWNNFCIILNHEDLREYAVVRADNFGWGDGWAACTATCGHSENWGEWLPAMDGAKVTARITNNGDGTADIKAEMLGNDGVTYYQEYIGINTIDKNDMYFRFVCEGSHLVFDTEESYIQTVYPTPTVLGAEDNSTPWWTVHTDNMKVEPFHTSVVNFTNYTNGLANWNNFCIVLNGEDVAKEYIVVRADNWGWGNGWDGCEKIGTQGDWGTWLAAMNGARVTASIKNNGNGTADIRTVMYGNDGNTYTQDYLNIPNVEKNDMYFRFVCEGSHLVFDTQAAKKRRSTRRR